MWSKNFVLDIYFWVKNFQTSSLHSGPYSAALPKATLILSLIKRFRNGWFLYMSRYQSVAISVDFLPSSRDFSAHPNNKRSIEACQIKSNPLEVLELTEQERGYTWDNEKGE